MEFIGVYKDTDGKIKNNLYYSWEEWHKDTFSPATKIISVFELKVYGKSYKERKNDLKTRAICYQDTYNYVSWSYGEIAEISDFFYKNGKRYGLLREFKENGIL